MNSRGIIFDFNGTLFWDTKLQNDSWDKFLAKYNISLSDKEKDKYVHGINMKDSFAFLFKREMNADEIHRYTEEKEVIYRQMCLENGMELAPGALELIRSLLKKNIPIAIATASAKGNVDFFIEHFNLLEYFKNEHIIYNDGTIRGKPHPDLFTKAINALNISAKDATIFEDSYAGIKAAANAHAGEIIIVNSINGNYSNYDYSEITHFNQFVFKHKL